MTFHQRKPAKQIVLQDLVKYGHMSVPSQMPCLAMLPHQAELVVLRGHDFCAGSLLEKKDSVRVFFLAFLDFCAFLRAKLFFLKRTASRNKPAGISAAVPTGTDQKADS